VVLDKDTKALVKEGVVMMLPKMILVEGHLVMVTEETLPEIEFKKKNKNNLILTDKEH
jgi:hypothetical protein